MNDRELKFRAWHKEHGMIYPHEHFSLQTAINGEIEFFGSPAKDFALDDFTFLQYTGLKDRNGKEIYEGDVVTSTHPDITPGFGWLVCWKNAGFYPFSDRDEGTLGELGWYGVREQLETFEVVGNIYENPELEAFSGV